MYNVYRLGRKGVDELRAHPWFSGLDWDNLRSYPAPFVPEVREYKKLIYSGTEHILYTILCIIYSIYRRVYNSEYRIFYPSH